MDTARKGSSATPHYRPWASSQLVPGALGVCAALLLGGLGFGVGVGYAELALPAPAALRVARTGVERSPVPLPALAAMDAMGGPEESGPDEQAPQPLAPVAEQAAGQDAGQAAGQADAGPAAAPDRPASRQPWQPLAMARPVVGGWISSSFGERVDPFTGQPALHKGLDFAGLDNSAILAVAPGVVTWSGRQRGYGNLIEIDHGGGWVTRYGHNAFNLVRPGDYVKPGQTIALMGATGRATGTHLHFEVLYRGRHRNPARYVPRDA